MAHVAVHRDGLELDEPVFVEGLPGVGLVGKIAADHLVESMDLVEYATVHCDGLPEVAVFQGDEHTYRPPVRIYADAERDLLVLRSDVPVSPSAADDFAVCLVRWLSDQDATPLFLSGLPAEKSGVPELYGVASDDSDSLLDEHDIGSPPQSGVISGPTGALLYQSQVEAFDAYGLVVESNSDFPDPEAARVLLLDGIAPTAGISVDTDRLVEQAEEISEAREQFAKQMQEAGDESSGVRPVGMYQ